MGWTQKKQLIYLWVLRTQAVVVKIHSLDADVVPVVLLFLATLHMVYLAISLCITAYSGPCDLRPLYLTIPCILRPDISNTTCIFSV